MTNIIGANWRTSLTGLAETACLIIIGLCALPSEVWSNPKVYLPTVGLIVAKTIKDFITKDKNVTGGAVQQNPAGNVTGEAKTVAPAIPKKP